MAIKYGSPTFILREECERDLLEILGQLAARGFQGVELYGLFGYDAVAIQEKCDEVGLAIICDHIRYDEFVKDPERVLQERSPLGLEYITIDEIPESKLPGTSGFSDAIKQIERISAMCKQAGMQLLYHNQGFDVMTRVSRKPMLEILLDSVAPELLQFQIDLGWLAIGGVEPAYFLDKYGDRCPMIHLKDYYATGPVLLKRAIDLACIDGGNKYNNFEFRPTGYGVMEFASLMPAVLACNPQWIVADHDLSYDGNSLDDLGISLEYIKKLVSYYGGVS